MTRLRRRIHVSWLGLAILWMLAAPGTVVGTHAQSAAPPQLSREQIETFLATARIASVRAAGKGVTNSRRATLTDGTITHDAHIQTVDEFKMQFRGTRGTELNFKDSYRFNIAAYRMDKLLGLNMVPASVERKFEGTPASFTWWLDDVAMDEGARRKSKESPNPDLYARQIHQMRVFHELIYNTDPNAGNILWGKDWRLWLIDHTRAFRNMVDLISPKLLERCERRLFDGIRKLDEAILTQAMGPYLNRDEIRAMLTRRDKIVKIFADKVASKGETAVLYDREGSTQD